MSSKLVSAAGFEPAYSAYRIAHLGDLHPRTRIIAVH